VFYILALDADDHTTVLLFSAWGVAVQKLMAGSGSGTGSDGHRQTIEKMELQRRVAKGAASLAGGFARPLSPSSFASEQAP
jgi:hypothetical protein